MINTRLSPKLVRRTAAFVAAIVLGIVGPQPLQGEEDEPIPPGECGDNKMCTYYRYLQWAPGWSDVYVLDVLLLDGKLVLPNL